MRLIQVTIPTWKREAILGALDDEEIDYVLSDETSGREYTAIAYVPLPQSALFAFLVRTIHLIPPVTDVTIIDQVRERIAPDFLSLAVALGAGSPASSASRPASRPRSSA